MNQENPTEQYLQQLRNMGFNEDMIELYRKQMTQYVNLANDWASQMNESGGDTSSFQHFFNDDDNSDEEGEELTVCFNPASDLTEAEKWAVACGADLAFANGQYLDDVTTGLGKALCRQLLSEWWDIDSREELLETIEWLREEGHRLQYDTICQALNTVSMKESKEFLRAYAIANEQDEEMVMGRLRNTRDALELFRKEQLIGNATQPDTLIWDYARIINLSRAGYDAEYIDRAEALELIMGCVSAVKSSYHSWKEMSVSYQFARCVWNGVDIDSFQALRAGMDTLLNHEDSPWVLLPWNA